MTTTTDIFGRKHTYMRISLTDKCNLSCQYCSPRSYLKNPFLSPGAGRHSLSSNQIISFISISAKSGIKKVRFTGGEPLLRDDICEIIQAAKRIRGIQRVCITTNGVLLKNKALFLKHAGLDSLNVSLDSLAPERFRKITGSDKFHEVIDGIHAALRGNLNLKLNVVALSDLSLIEVDRFINFAMDNSITVRFIELMPVYGKSRLHGEITYTGSSSALGGRTMPPCSGRIENHIRNRFELSACGMDGVAKTYKIGAGKVGFITPLSAPFCGGCNRLRLSSNGILYRCLFDASGIDVKPYLVRRDYKTLSKEIKRFLAGKKESHFLNSNHGKKNLLPLMKSIGG